MFGALVSLFTMKRSSSVAQLAEPEPESIWNRQEDVLATSMLLVSINEETNHSLTLLRKASGSMGSMASSRCSSKGSLSGWGSTASRKSYKVDLSSIGFLENEADRSHKHHLSSSPGRLLPKEPSYQKHTNPSICVAAFKVESISNDSSLDLGDSWGFFVD